MIYLIALILLFIFCAVTHKFHAKKEEELERRMIALEDAVFFSDSTTAGSVANGTAVGVNNELEVGPNE